MGGSSSGNGKLGLGIVVGLVVAALVVVAGTFGGLITFGDDAAEPTQTPSQGVESEAPGAPEETEPAESPAGETSGKFEGEGLSTAEEVAFAYVDAIAALDSAELERLYAIESFVENCDSDAYLKRMGVIMPAQGCVVPAEAGDAGVQMATAMRRREVLERTTLVMAAAAAPSLNNELMPRAVPDEEEIDEFFDNVIAELEAFEGGLGAVEVANPLDYLDQEMIDRTKQLMDQDADVLGVGAGDVEAVLLTIELHGQTQLFAPRLVRYDERWYVYSESSMLGLAIGIPTVGIGVP